ncbi:MAG TPA: hypothetical protein VIU61_10150 [Kofleriaceae bacterium]
MAILIALLIVTPNIAQADDQATAMALFDEGLKEMKAKNFDKACKAFAASLALVADSGTKGSLARCYTEQGKVASAWGLWRDLADTAPTPKLREDAALRAKKLEPRIPKYSLKVIAPTPGLAVTVNGSPVNATVEAAVPIDPGPLSVTARATGYVVWTRDETAKEGAVVAIEIPALERLGATTKLVVPPMPMDERARKRKTRHRIGIVIGAGAGGAAVIVGSVFGFRARSQYADAKDTCGGSIEDCDPARVMEAQGQVDDARSSGTLSTVMFAVGGAAVITGVVIYMTAPKLESRGVTIAPAVDHQSAGVTLLGRF